MTTLSTQLPIQPLTAHLKTVDGGAPLTFQLVNHTSDILTLYWLDRSGAEQQYGSVQPGQTISQPTAALHAWEVKSASGAVGFEFVASTAGLIDVRSATDIGFTDFSEKILETPAGAWSTAQGHGLINVAKSLGVPDLGANLPMNVQGNNVALNAISASSAWAAGYTGKGVTVAVVDSGIAAHPEVDGVVIGGHDFLDNDNDARPAGGAYEGHSLGVAAIIAGSHTLHAGQDTMGVAPDAKLLNVRASGPNGGTLDAMVAGIRYAVDNGAKVICMPLQNQGLDNAQSLVDAVHYAYTHDVVMVIIGGNFSNYGPTGPAMIAQSGEAIAVGNYNALAAASFTSSNMAGPTPFPWVMASSSGYVPDPTGGYTYWQDGGTSFAGPYVAGLAALLLQQHPTASAASIIKAIVGGASLPAANSLPTAGTASAAVPGVHVAPATGGAFTDTPGADAYVGGAGIDSVAFSGKAADYTIERIDGKFTVTNDAARTIDTLVGIEHATFADTAIALDVDGAAGQVYRLYQAAFNRAPDAGGVGYWLAQAEHGARIADIAQAFLDSAEFHAAYGTHPGNAQLVEAMYQNVLHRAPDAGGLAYWTGAMERGMSAVQLLTSFSDSPENQAAVARVIGEGFGYTPWHG